MQLLRFSNIEYQVFHPWHWLTYGQNAQAAAILVSACVNLVTVAVLIRTLIAVDLQARASRRQAQAAEEQVKSAKAATQVSEEQLKAARESAAAEREHSDLLRQQYLAALRPVLVFQKRISPPFTFVELVNESNALALEVSLWNGSLDALGAKGIVGKVILGAGSSSSLKGIKYGEAEYDKGKLISAPEAPLFAKYRSQDGRWFITAVSNVNTLDEFEQTFLEI
jgi:hypothetical protein